MADGVALDRRVALRDRICCYEWTWFTMTMATGGVASVLSSVPFQADWVHAVGLLFFLFNLFLFLVNCTLISLRFYWRPATFLASFVDESESLFVSAFFVSLATIFMTICQYGIPHAGPWLLRTMELLFWVYVAVGIAASAGIYLILWSTLVFPIHTMTPVWVFPAYPMLLTAPFGASLIAAAVDVGQVSSIDAVVITLAAVTVQGTGFLIAFTICAAFIYRLMTQQLPQDSQRPGMFISIGPGGFTAVGIVHLGNLTAAIFPSDWEHTEHAVFTLRLLAYMLGLWLWGLSVWFSLVSVGSLWKFLLPHPRSKMPFSMTWFSFVFPNTALVTATCQIGVAFDCTPLQILACVLSGVLVLVWATVFATMLRSLRRRTLLWPKEPEQE